MKRTSLIVLAILLTVSINGMAQRNRNEFSTIFSKQDSNRIEHGGYGSFGVGYATINGKDALIGNFRGAWVINHSFALGIAGKSFINNLDKTANSDDYYLIGGYGGLFLEKTILPNSPIHISIPVILGAGGVTVLPNNFWNNYNYEINEYDVFFVFEPGVELEFNIVKFFRISMGASYRFTNGVILNDPNDQLIGMDALDGINYNINFKFGKF